MTLEEACHINPGGNYLFETSGRDMSIDYRDAALMANLATNDGTERISLIEPFIGGGIIPAVATALYPHSIAAIVGGDYDKDSADVARRNIALVTKTNAVKKREEQLCLTYGSTKIDFDGIDRVFNHAEEIEAEYPIPFSIGKRNAFSSKGREDLDNPIVISDVPHGKASLWVDVRGEKRKGNMLGEYLIHLAEKTPYLRAIVGTAIEGHNGKGFGKLEREIRQYWDIVEKVETNFRAILSLARTY